MVGRLCVYGRQRLVTASLLRAARDILEAACLFQATKSKIPKLLLRDRSQRESETKSTRPFHGVMFMPATRFSLPHLTTTTLRRVRISTLGFLYSPLPVHYVTTRCR
jgi:hypothetical protein